MKKTTIFSCFLMMLALFAATNSYPADLVYESFESGYGMFHSGYNDSDIVSDATAPLGSHSLRFTFPEGFSAGDAPDIVTASFSDQQEIWGRVYFKLSSGFSFHPYEQKLVFLWTGRSNFYFSIGDTKIFGCWQGDGRTYNNYDQPDISTGVWNRLDFHMSTDGVVQLWVNDSLTLNLSNVPFNGGAFDSIAFTPVYGGMGGSVPKTQYIWFDGGQISTTPIGPAAPLPPPPAQGLQPSPPTHLTIN